ncbi:MAG: flagellar protein FlgN [Pseudomonadota bacterium]|nr:flagellar protein FlgN [Pseudomonadota bacterium]
MQAERTQQSLEDLLTREIQCSERLLVCLQAERSALTQRDLQALEKTTQDKIQHTRQLEQLDQQRQKLVSELGFAEDAESLQRCLDSLPRADALKHLWQQILTNIEACQTGNLTNGGILESGRQHIEQALRILRGQSASPSLYDPHGDTPANLGQRELGKV